nr:class I SAM-dependent methyltransferase [Streptomyces sp. SID8352]
MCQTLIELHRPDARTLVDFGCGTGRDLEILAKHFECIGVDLQPGMVDHAHQARPELDIRTGDMRTVRLGQRMDVVTCMGNSLAYVHDNEAISQVFATFAAHARPGALLVLCSPVAPITRDRADHRLGRHPDGIRDRHHPPHVGPADPDQHHAPALDASLRRRGPRRDPQTRPVPPRTGTLRGGRRLRGPGHERRHRDRAYRTHRVHGGPTSAAVTSGTSNGTSTSRPAPDGSSDGNTHGFPRTTTDTSGTQNTR